MITIGKTHELSVVRSLDAGYYLDARNLGEVFLEKRWGPRALEPGDTISVFLYRDGEGALLATTEKPRIEVGQFGYLPLAQLTPYGAFMDWGLEKNLFIPFAEQHLKLEEGRNYLVHAYVNALDQRIVGSTKIDKYINLERPHQFQVGDAVSLTIANSSALGYKAIINKTHWGLLKREEIFQRISFGQSLRGFIQGIRPDGKINLTLNGGHRASDGNGRKILKHLANNGGFVPLHDKSDPKLIYSTYGISKASFKKAIGNLYKQKMITIEATGIKLT
jgi:predicted RNA-binding protein (virulence factor B family)